MRPITSLHGTIERYLEGCFGTDCPSTPSCADTNLIRLGIITPPAADVVEAQHGTAERYAQGCFGTDCPSTPSCADVNLGISSPRKKTPAAVHGTVWGYRNGCHIVDECPNHLVEQTACAEAHQQYYRDYRERRRNGEGPAIIHGTPYGYQMGCFDREACPRDVRGLSCRDAAAAEETTRRRRAGATAKRPVVDAQPVREHVNYLRENGMGIMRIAKVAGVSKTGLRTLVYGREDYLTDGARGPRHGEVPKHIEASKAERILALTPDPYQAASSAVHGTRNGYRVFKCRTEAECPNKETSCGQANSIYQAEIRTRRAQKPLEATQ